jgi:hypothetical protein
MRQGQALVSAMHRVPYPTVLFEYSLRNTEVQILYPVVLVLLLTDLNSCLNVADFISL